MTTPPEGRSDPPSGFFAKRISHSLTHNKMNPIMTIAERSTNILDSFLSFVANVPVGFASAMIYTGISTWLNAEMEFLTWLAGMLVFDALTGMVKHIRYGTATKDGFSRFFDKLVVAGGWLFVTNFIVSWTGNAGWDAGIFKTTSEFTLIWWIGWSLVQNIYIISGKKFPPESFLNMIQKFSLSKIPAAKNENPEPTKEP